MGACAGSDLDDGAESNEEALRQLTPEEKAALCAAIPAPRPWTAAEQQQLLDRFVASAVKRKIENDALIRDRGVGGFTGAGTGVWKALSKDPPDVTKAAELIRPRLKPGQDAMAVARSMKGTSCIGYLYTVFKEVYDALGRSNEWAAIEKCGRAWDSEGLKVQQALIRAGWVSPALPFVSDENKFPGGASEQTIHKGLLDARATGKYFGTPISQTKLLENFLPTKGSSTPKDESMFLRIGKSNTLAFGTFRAAFHTPAVVPAHKIPDSVAPTDGTRAAWLAARDRGEPFVIESHKFREAWDPTNFEIRPLRFVMEETFDDSVTYATGTLLFAPGGEAMVQ